MEDLKISDEEPPRPVYGGSSLIRALATRQTGRRIGTKTIIGIDKTIEELAENRLIDRGEDFEAVQCQLGGATRSTFLMVFSPDRTMMASTHGDHNIYVTETKTGRCLQTLKGHPRTPWCIEFHPAHSGIIASGCLGGQVRVWDLHCGSEVWVTEGVISSLTFHPVERLLVIATFNELHFWDWSSPEPAVKVSTVNEKEKLRYVKFDRLGHHLITGIANLALTQPRQSPPIEALRPADLPPAVGPGGDGPDDRSGGAGGNGGGGGLPVGGAPGPSGGGGGDGAGDSGGNGGGNGDENSRRMTMFALRYEQLMQRYRYQQMIIEERANSASWNPTPPSQEDQPDFLGPRSEAGRLEAADPPSLSRSSTVRGPVSSLRRYRRFSVLLDRDDLDQPVRRSPPEIRFRPSAIGRAHRASRGREGMLRLRRVESFREAEGSPPAASEPPPGHMASDYHLGVRNESRINFRRQLRERMLQLRQLRRQAMEALYSGRHPASLNGSSTSPPANNTSAGINPANEDSGGIEASSFGEQQRLNIVGPPERSPTLSSSPRSNQTTGYPRASGIGGVTSGPLHRNPLQTHLQLRRISRLGDPLPVLDGGRRNASDGIFEESVQRVTLAVDEVAVSEIGQQQQQHELEEDDMVEDIMREMMEEENTSHDRYYDERSSGLQVRIQPGSDYSSAFSRDGGRLRRRVERHLSEMSPPVSIPQPTLYVERHQSPQRSEVGRSPVRSTGDVGRSPSRSSGALSDLGRSPPRSSIELGRSPSRATEFPRSPGRSPARSGGGDPDALLSAVRPRPSRGRRSTADAPSTILSDRLQSIHTEMSSMLAAQIGENPFTSRPPSSASEVELELPASSHNSTVSSPIPRPLTARGRHSVDLDGLDSRRSISSDLGGGLETPVPPPTPADMMSVELGEEDLASDSSSSRPGSRIADRPSLPRRLSLLPAADWRRARRGGLQRLQEEEGGGAGGREPASALSSPGSAGWPTRRSRGDSDSTVEQDIGDMSDAPEDSLEAYLPARESFEAELNEETEVSNIGQEAQTADNSESAVESSAARAELVLTGGEEAVPAAAAERGQPIEVVPHTLRTVTTMNPINHSEPADRLEQDPTTGGPAIEPVWQEPPDWLSQPAAAVFEMSDAAPEAVEPVATAAAVEIEQAGPSSSSNSNISDANRRHSLDISLLARHIEHMQRICRASLEDLPHARQRRQIIRLQGIRRMLEDLHRQIRQLQTTVQVESGTDVLPESTGSANSSTNPSGSTSIAAARSHGMTASRSRRIVGPARRYLSSRSRLTRAHSQLVSRLHATFRAMELSPDLARRGISPLNDSLTEASRTVLVRHQPLALPPSLFPSTTTSAASTSTPSATTTMPASDFAERARSDLRSMSERLERLLRERREAMEQRRRLHSHHRGGGLEGGLYGDGEHHLLRHHHLYPEDEEDEEEDVGLVARRRGGSGSFSIAASPPTATERFHATLARNRNDIERAARLDVLLDSSSQSESEEERGAAFTTAAAATAAPSAVPSLSARTSFARTSLRNLSRRENLTDYFDHESYLQARRRALRSAVGRPGGRDSPIWDSGPNRYLDRIYRMRTAERMLEQRLRVLGSPAERLPPLRELIWRRLRRRNGEDEEPEQQNQQPAADLDRDRNSSGDGWDRNRHREALREMVDQLTIHQEELGSFQRFIPDHSSRMYSRVFSRMREPPQPRERSREEVRRAAHNNRDFFAMQQMPSSSLTHRIQIWEFWSEGIPDISRSEHNIVVREAKIHNDASVDISEEGRLLVTLVPSNLPMTTLVGLYSLHKESLGQVLATYSLESCAVSVSLSPTSRHLLVGLTSRTSRIISLSPADRQLMAQVFRIKLPAKAGERGRFVHRKDINQVDTGHMSLNCIRWIPAAGQGIVYATNTGLLKILR